MLANFLYFLIHLNHIFIKFNTIGSLEGFNNIYSIYTIKKSSSLIGFSFNLQGNGFELFSYGLGIFLFHFKHNISLLLENLYLSKSSWSNWLSYFIWKQIILSIAISSILYIPYLTITLNIF